MKRLFFKIFQLFLFLCATLEAHMEKTHYVLTAEPIDVVIPCCAKDLTTLELCIQGVRQYGRSIRRVIVVSKERLTESAEWFDESLYPFSKKDVALEIFHQNRRKAEKYLNHPKTRIGWIYQQFLKFYAPFVIPGISSNVLVLDADVIFLNPVAFMTEDGEPFFTTGEEYHQPYFAHMARLLPDLKRVREDDSGIVHHMLFQRAVLKDLHDMVYSRHKAELWKAVCRCIDPAHLYRSSFSEYEIYFNFSLMRTEQAHPRSIRWKNCKSIGAEDLKKYQKSGYIYVACHSWERKKSLINDDSHRENARK